MWIVQNNFIKPDQYDPLIENLERMQEAYETVKIIPFSDEFATPLTHDRKDLIPFGSTSLMRIAHKRGWTGLFYDPETFQVKRWINERSDMLNQDAQVMTVKEAMQLFTKANPTDEWFIRPNADLKRFNGSFTTAEEISRWIESVESGNFQFNEEELVSIASPKFIVAEYRFFIVNRRIVTGSLYRMRGQKLTSMVKPGDWIWDEAQKLAEGWLPHETCVMDLSQGCVLRKTPDLKIIEFNCLNASGFYNNDVSSFTKAVTDYFKLINK